MKKISILSGVMLLSASVYANNDPVSLRIKTVANDTGILYVQANENQVTVNNVIVNRGNCEVITTFHGRNVMDPIETKGANTPVTLRFGQEHNYNVIGCSASTIKEVQVVTNHGTVTFSR